MKCFPIKIKPKETRLFNSALMIRLVVFVVLLLSPIIISGQNIVGSTKEDITDKIVMPSQNVELSFDDDNVAMGSKMDLVFWLMGSKQSQTFNVINSANTSEKERYKNAGLSTKGVLYRTFFKKMINHKSTIV